MTNTKTIAYNNDIVRSKAAVAAIGVTFFIVATMLGAYVRIPVPGTPVPITLQTFFALLAGAVLGKRLGFISMLGYVAIGGAWLAGPTGGYIVGFAAAAYLVGALIERHVPALVAFIAGSVAVYTCGVSWLVLAYKLPLAGAFSVGILPFIPGDLVKIAVAALVFSRIAKRTKEIFSV